MGLIFTGLPLKYSGQPWAQKFVKALGGFESTSVCHHFFAVILLTTCGVHLVIVGEADRAASWPERDLEDSCCLDRIRWFPVCVTSRTWDGMIRWFFGVGPKPRFRALDVLGEIRLLGYLPGGDRDRCVRIDALAAQLFCRDSAGLDV